MTFLRFLSILPLLLFGTLWASPRAGEPSGLRYDRFELSGKGSSRATAYPQTNKIVTVGSRTHVTWLDSEEDGFWVRIRTLDRNAGEWLPTRTVGRAQDNHGGAALSVDAEGYLHIIYYPHHESMRYRRSLRPNDASAWSEEVAFGADLTYPVLLCAPDGTLLMTARRAYHPHQGFTPPKNSPPWETELWRRRPGEDWERVGPLLRGRFAGYAQFAEAFWWGGDGRTLHLACRIYETDYHGTGALFNTVGYLVSHDQGETWQRSDGTHVNLPATAETVDVLREGGSAQDTVLVGGGLIADAADRPVLFYSVVADGKTRSYLAAHDSEGRWTQRDLSECLPSEWTGWGLSAVGGITRSADGRITLVATLLQVPEGENWWGHASGEVGRFWSDDGGETFSFELLGTLDPEEPHWLPNIERPTGHHAVPSRPGIIYTAGEAGADNETTTSNGVIWWGIQEIHEQSESTPDR